MPIRVLILVVVALALGLFLAALVDDQEGSQSTRGAPASAIYDVVIRNGRVMDPESGLDGVRNVGIRGGKVAAITPAAIRGRDSIDAHGLVVAPGFIDLHWRMKPQHYQFQVLDGVTTALELAVGTGDVDRWYAERGEKALINFGVSVGHGLIRMAVMRDPGPSLPTGDARERGATDAEIVEIQQRIERALPRGAVAVTFSLITTPAASGWESLETFRAAARAGAPVYAGIRGVNWEVDDMPRFLTEAIGAAAVTGAALQVHHLTASGGPHTPRLLRIIQEARAQGLDVTADMFPYSSAISHIKLGETGDDWRSWPDEAFRDLEWLETGERLTRESYSRYRERGGFVIVHNQHIEPIVTEAVASPLTMIASSAFLDDQGHGHPRSSGTHARVLGHYVREQRVLSLREALRKMTLMPSQLLKRRVPTMRNKGRIREGADADIVVFDPARIIDRATYREPTRPSDGVRHVLVNGVLVVRDGMLQEGVRPGRPVRAPIQADPAQRRRP